MMIIMVCDSKKKMMKWNDVMVVLFLFFFFLNCFCFSSSVRCCACVRVATVVWSEADGEKNGEEKKTLPGG